MSYCQDVKDVNSVKEMMKKKGRHIVFEYKYVI